jgi:hypothetical protein
MQEPYHIGVSLQEYHRIFLSGGWRIPDFSKRCLICGVGDCAKYHGIYERRAICPQSGFEVADLPVVRYLCHAKGQRKNCDHVTFSLLPLVLVPYRELTLKFMVLALWLRLRDKLSLFAAMDAIEEELVNFKTDVGDFVSIAAQLQWERLIRAGFDRFWVSGMFNEEQIGLINKAPEKALMVFLKMMFAYQSQRSDVPIRGPDGLAWDFYQLNGGGNKLAPFLFGTASQHRD